MWFWTSAYERRMDASVARSMYGRARQFPEALTYHSELVHTYLFGSGIFLNLQPYNFFISQRYRYLIMAKNWFLALKT